MFEKYAAYGFEDFVKDEFFVKWVQNPDGESDHFWAEFLQIFPYQRRVTEQARQIILQLGQASQVEAPKEDAEEIWTALQESLRKPASLRPLSKYGWMSAAAAVFLLAGTAFLVAIFKWPFSDNDRQRLFTYEETFEKTNHDEWREITNLNESEQVVVLPDSSIVKLQPKATLAFRKQFDGAFRKVQLVGEAFFEVKRNSEKPFIVLSNGLITKVLGTSFNIKADKGSDKVMVAVRTGKVSVFANRWSRSEDPEADGLILRANQQVAYSKKIEQFTRSLVPDPVPVITPDELQKFEFRNAAVTEIFRALEIAYDTEILFDEELLSECRLTSTLDLDVSLFEKLDVICEAIDATYKVVDAHVVVTGRKCL